MSSVFWVCVVCGLCQIGNRCCGSFIFGACLDSNKKSIMLLRVSSISICSSVIAGNRVMCCSYPADSHDPHQVVGPPGLRDQGDWHSRTLSFNHRSYTHLSVLQQCTLYTACLIILCFSYGS